MRSIKRALAVVLALAMVMAMAGCSAGESAAPSSEAPSESEVSTASEPSPESETEQKPVLLVVSFGTSYNDNRDLSIGAIENALQEAYPDYEVRRAFTSQIIIDKLKERDGLEIDNVSQAMIKLVADGVKNVVVQPTHVMSGYEYDDVVKEVNVYKDAFDSLKFGAPLLTTDADYEKVVSIITEETAEYNVDGTAIVFMGHGTSHPANMTYTKLQQRLADAGFDRYIVGTVEATPSLDDVMAAVEKLGATRVVLRPLMIVAGDHANNDMAGDEEGSWKTTLEGKGYEVVTVIEGLGQSEAIQQMFVEHAADAMNGDGAPVVTAAFTAEQIAEGTYPISVTSSSSMFKVVDAQLTVKGGAMTCVITMSGDGYGKLFMGTGEEALAAAEDKYIPSVANAEGKVTFEVPVEALNTPTACAAWSLKKEQWYDRTLVFESASIPTSAYTVG